jgi:hypothetical protein
LGIEAPLQPLPKRERLKKRILTSILTLLSEIPLRGIRGLNF